MNRCTAILGVLALLGVTTAHVGAATFGPGDHWVDTVTEGTFAMDVEAEFTATIPGMGTETFDLTGPMTVWYGDARDTP